MRSALVRDPRPAATKDREFAPEPAENKLHHTRRPWLGRLIHEERGAVTAEFAIVLPVVVAVLGLVIGAITLAAHRITLVAISAEVARSEARGDTARAQERLQGLGAATEVVRRAQGTLHCVELSDSPMGGLLRAVTIRAESCAALTGAA